MQKGGHAMTVLIIALVAALISSSRDKSYIELLETEILVRDIVIKDYQDKDNKNQGGLNESN